MTPIDYLLLAGVLVAAGYVLARLFTGWLRSSGSQAGLERESELNAPLIPERKFERVEKTGAPWSFRK